MNLYRESFHETSKFIFKILIIGDGTSGKSSILNRYTDNTFNTNYTSTIGVDFKTKIVKINDKTVKLQIWDTAGQERFKAVTTVYYRGINGILLVYDVTSRISFNNIDRWIDEIIKYAPPDVLILLIGNKSDFAERQVSIEEGIEKAKELNLLFIETSAKDNINIEKAFEIIAEKLSIVHKNSEQTMYITHFKQFDTESIEPEKSFFNKWCNIL